MWNLSFTGSWCNHDTNALSQIFKTNLTQGLTLNRLGESDCLVDSWSPGQVMATWRWCFSHLQVAVSHRALSNLMGTQVNPTYSFPSVWKTQQRDQVCRAKWCWEADVYAIWMSVCQGVTLPALTLSQGHASSWRTLVPTRRAPCSLLWKEMCWNVFLHLGCSMIQSKAL